MDQRRELLQTVLSGLTGVKGAYFQPKKNITLEYPAITYERSGSDRMRADNLLYFLKKRYDVTVIQRESETLIPDQVEGLPHSQFNRFFVRDGLNHYVYQLFF